MADTGSPIPRDDAAIFDINRTDDGTDDSGDDSEDPNNDRSRDNYHPGRHKRKAAPQKFDTPRLMERPTVPFPAREGLPPSLDPSPGRLPLTRLDPVTRRRDRDMITERIEPAGSGTRAPTARAAKRAGY